jgi:filamin
MMKVEELFADLEDGLYLINLLEIISNQKIPNYNKKPRIRAQKLENNSFALNFLKKEGIKLVAIGPEDIVDKAGKLILGLIWTIILRYQIQKGDGAGGAKQELLEWVRRQIPECDVQNFTTSWTNGKAICHLTDAMERGCIKPDLASVDKNPNALANAQLGEDTAEKVLGIPKILAPEDMVSSSPDELSVMTYISFFRDYLDNLAKKRGREAQERIAVPEKTIAHGAGLQEGEQFIPAEFTIQAKNCFGTNCPCGGETFDVTIQAAAKSAPIPVQIKDNNDGTYTVNYTPVESGRHVVAVNLKGKPISGSPYNVPIARTSVTAEGEGLQHGEQYIPANFVVKAHKLFEKGVAPTSNDFGIKINGPLKTVLPVVTDNKDGTYTVQYTPNENGRHVVDVQLFGKPIANGPFSVPIDKTLCTASGPGLEKAEQFIPAHFQIEAKNFVLSGNSSGPSDFDINISGPKPVDGPIVKDNKDGTFDVTYTPTAPGRYVVSIQLKGQPISNGPFTVNVNKTGCSASGPGLDQGEQFIPSSFDVSAKPLFDAGIPVHPHDIDVAINGPKGPVHPNIKDNKDGTFTVSFTPQDIGRYPIAVSVLGQPITNVSVPVAKTTVNAYGPGLEKATQFVPAEFVVDAKVLELAGEPLLVDEIVTEITGPSGPVKATIKKNPDGLFNVTYTPNDVGRHTINVAVKGVPIANKSVPVGKAGISAAGDGLDRAEQYIPSSFDIDAKELKDSGVAPDARDFDVQLVGPAGEVPVKVVDNGDGTYTCTYTPQEPGRHKLDVNLKGKPVLNNYQIPVDKSSTDPHKTTASGPGIQPGNLINQPTHFTIQARNKIGDPMKTGGDPFKVSVTGPYNVDAEPTLRDNGDGTYYVEYEPTVAGPYKVEVTLNGTPISGSPWEFDINRSDTDPDPAQFDVYGPGLEGGDTANPATFTIVAKNSKGQPLSSGGHPVETQVFDKVGNEVPTKVIDNHDGTYTVNYNPVDPGDHKIDVMLRTKKPLFYDHIKDSPYFVPIAAGTDPAHSLVWGPGLEDVYDTKPATFFIKARDRDDNDMGKGGDPFEVQVQGPKGEVPAKVVDNDDGTYTVTYSPQDHGKHTVYVTLKNNAVAKSPYTVNVKEGADWKTTFIEKFQFTIRTKTKAGNFKTVGGETFNIDISGPNGSIPAQNIDTHDNNDGSYTVNYLLPGSGDYNVSVKLNDQDIQGSPYPQGRPYVLL